MAVREEGEFELILGNRQLLSVLFIVVVLLGVFFAMGFLAGRSTSGTVAKGGSEVEAPRVVEPVSAGVKQPAETQAPERAVPPAATGSTEAGKQESKAAATELPPPPPVPAATTKPAAAGSGGFIESPPAGTYLQAAATRREDAMSMLSLLKQDGLPGYVTPSPKAEMFRVLIGPLSGNESIAEAREKLANRGIKSPYIVKY
jgi:cell division septation protein DedD